MAEERIRNAVVLVVDDDDDIRETVEFALQMRHHETAGSRDGAAALEWLRDHEAPGLILLDLMMPVMSGWQLLEELQQDARLSCVPIVVMTAFGKDLGTAASLPLLRKPIDLKTLHDTVGTYCPGGP